MKKPPHKVTLMHKSTSVYCITTAGVCIKTMPKQRCGLQKRQPKIMPTDNTAWACSTIMARVSSKTMFKPAIGMKKLLLKINQMHKTASA